MMRFALFPDDLDVSAILEVPSLIVYTPAQDSVDDLVTFGYMRRASKAFKHLVIPTGIWQICSLFAIENDKFGECGSALKLHNDQYAFTSKSGIGGTCYGTFCIGNNNYSSAFIYLT